MSVCKLNTIPHKELKNSLQSMLLKPVYTTRFHLLLMILTSTHIGQSSISLFTIHYLYFSLFSLFSIFTIFNIHYFHYFKAISWMWAMIFTPTLITILCVFQPFGMNLVVAYLFTIEIARPAFASYTQKPRMNGSKCTSRSIALKSGPEIDERRAK